MRTLEKHVSLSAHKPRQHKGSLLRPFFFPRNSFDLGQIIYGEEEIFVGFDSQSLEQNGTVLDEKYSMSLSDEHQKYQPTKRNNLTLILQPDDRSLNGWQWGSST
jgi:hypothetical protein